MKKIGIAVVLAIFISLGLFTFRAKAESIDITGKTAIVTDGGTIAEADSHIVRNTVLKNEKNILRENFVIRLWQKADVWRKVIVAAGILVVAAVIVLIVTLAGKHNRKRKSKYNPYFDENGNEITESSSEQTVSWRQSGFGDIVEVSDEEVKDTKETENQTGQEMQENMNSVPPVSQSVEEPKKEDLPFDAQSAVATAARSATVYSFGLEEDSDVTPVSPEDFYNQLSERTGDILALNRMLFRKKKR